MRSLTRRRLHGDCFACGDVEAGLRLTFAPDGDHRVRAQWFGDERFQGYSGIVHGGIVATLLDAAMTNCLLRQEIEAVTADMQVRYKKPVLVGQVVLLNAELVSIRGRVYNMFATALQDGAVVASARARFMPVR